MGGMQECRDLSRKNALKPIFYSTSNQLLNDA